jgi:hypothetical protein
MLAGSGGAAARRACRAAELGRAGVQRPSSRRSNKQGDVLVRHNMLMAVPGVQHGPLAIAPRGEIGCPA